jgi:hypothetical protein
MGGKGSGTDMLLALLLLVPLPTGQVVRDQSAEAEHIPSHECFSLAAYPSADHYCEINLKF